jgi:hypothetical protein
MNNRNISVPAHLLTAKTLNLKISEVPLPTFFGAFMMQTNCITFFLCPSAVDALSTSTFATLGSAATITDIIAAMLFVEGLSLEVAADREGIGLGEEREETRFGFLSVQV